MEAIVLCVIFYSNRTEGASKCDVIVGVLHLENSRSVVPRVFVPNNNTHRIAELILAYYRYIWIDRQMRIGERTPRTSSSSDTHTRVATKGDSQWV